MILQRLDMENFRQFYGKQSIDFGHNDETVTIIRGENGRGKTGIYRAVLYALYGDESLDQDGKDTSIVLPNIKALKEAQQSNTSVQMKVTVTFSKREKTYIITRSFLATITNDDNLLISNREVSFSDGVKMLTDATLISQEMVTILDERMKHYFFFDGEQMERLTRANAAQRRDVAAGIKNLLNIDQLRNAEKTLGLVANDVKKQLERHSSGKYQQNLQQQLQVEEILEQYKKQQETLEQSLEDVDEKLEAYTEQLENEKHYQKEKYSYTKLYIQFEQAEENENKALRALVPILGSLPLILLKDDIHRANASLDMLFSGSTEQTGVSVEWLDDLMTKLTCICNRSFEKGSNSYQAIEELREAAKKSAEKQQFYPLHAGVIRLLGHLDGKKAELDVRLAAYKEAKQKKEHLATEVGNKKEKSLQGAEEAITEIIQKRDRLLEKKTEITYTLKSLLDEMTKLEVSLQGLKNEEITLKVKSDIHQQLVRKQEVVEGAKVELSRIIADFEETMVVELEEVATDNLGFLLDESGLSNIKKVKIKNDYSLEVINSFGQEFLANISQGQRQILSLSFITALAQLAGGESMLEMPLFMDTPFGRLSSEHHDNLISFLPNVCSQWILLVTDREFSDEHESLLNEIGHLGPMYQLHTKEAGVTEIKPIEKEVHTS